MVQENVERERGTPNKTLLRRPGVIFGIANVVSTAATVYCCRSQVGVQLDWLIIIVGSFLSSLATIGGIAFADASEHSLFLGLAVRFLAWFLRASCSSGFR